MMWWPSAILTSKASHSTSLYPPQPDLPGFFWNHSFASKAHHDSSYKGQAARHPANKEGWAKGVPTKQQCIWLVLWQCSRLFLLKHTENSLFWPCRSSHERNPTCRAILHGIPNPSLSCIIADIPVTFLGQVTLILNAEAHRTFHVLGPD